MSVETQENIEENVEAPIVVDAIMEDQDEIKKDKGRTIVQEEQATAPEQEEETELESYSDNVKKRINQLTAKRKQALEEAQAAYQYAEQQKNENEQLKNRLQQLDQGYVNEYENRVKSQTAQAKKILEEANEALAIFDQLKKFLTDRAMLKVDKPGVWEPVPCLLDEDGNEVHFKEDTVIIRDKWSR